MNYSFVDADDLADDATVEDDVRILLTSCLCLAVKSGRASLILRVCCLMKIVLDSKSSSVNLLRLDVEPLIKDMVDYVGPSRASDGSVCEDLIAGNLVHKRELKMKKLMDHVFNFNNKGGAVITFGKSDHGKLGHGDSSVSFLFEVAISCLLRALDA